LPPPLSAFVSFNYIFGGSAAAEEGEKKLFFLQQKIETKKVKRKEFKYFHEKLEAAN
jgi:hypothetical protein